MHIKSRKLIVAYRILLLLVCGLGLVLSTNFSSGRISFYSYRYYTLQSNLLCFVYSLAILILERKSTSSSWFATDFKGAVTMAITVTMLVYQFMLSDTPFSMGAGDGALQNLITHLLLPLMVIFDWLLFDEKGRFSNTAPIQWLGIPLLYFAYALIAAPLGVTYSGGRRYPYPFLDVDALGWISTLKTVAILVLAFLILGYMIWGVDRLMGRRGPQDKRAKRAAPKP